jgi:hypothetical protein
VEDPAARRDALWRVRLLAESCFLCGWAFDKGLWDALFRFEMRLTFKQAAYLENGKPIRLVFLPDRLRRTFLDIASDNTRKGLEMCGILCGTLVNNALFISCLLIPEQK